MKGRRDEVGGKVRCVIGALVLIGLTGCKPDQASQRGLEPVSKIQAALGPDRLVAAYHFDEGSGAVAYDAAGLDNLGTVSGATWSLDGKYGGALSFDGTDDRVTVSDAVSLDLNTSLTLMAWVKPSSPAVARQTILAKGLGTSQLVYALFSANDDEAPAGDVDLYGYSFSVHGLLTAAAEHVVARGIDP